MIRRAILVSVLLGSAAQADEPAYRWGGGLDAHQPIWEEAVWTAHDAPPPLLVAAPDPAEGAPEPAPAPRGEPLLDDDYWLNYFNNIPRLFTAPLRFDTTDWIKTGAFMIAAGGAYLGDEHIRRFFRNHRTSTGDSVAAIGYRLGDGKTILGGVAVAYAAGYAIEDYKLRDTALLTLQAWALTGGLTEATKRLAGRQRPGYTDDKSQFEGWGGAGKSFFSGHVANAFTVAAVVSEQYDDVWVAPVAYGLAGLVAWSRLNDNAHWASDVVVGAGVGYAVGKLVAHFSPFHDDIGLTATPMIAPGGGGIQLGFRF
jgi:membrane-associated phospholipid phosphatase